MMMRAGDPLAEGTLTETEALDVSLVPDFYPKYVETICWTDDQSKSAQDAHGKSLTDWRYSAILFQH